MTKEQIDIVFKKKITPDNYAHCQFCINYQMFLKSIAALYVVCRAYTKWGY